MGIRPYLGGARHTLRGQAGAGDDGFPLKQARLRKAACFMLGTFADEEPFFVSQIDRNPALRELVKDLLVSKK